MRPGTRPTADMRGRPEVDGGTSGGITIEMQPLAIAGGGGMPNPVGTITVTLPHASAQSVTGSRLGDGLSSELYNVLIVAEPAKLISYEIGALAKLPCRRWPSRPHWIARGASQHQQSAGQDCATATAHLTDGDLAYLTSLYKMGTADTLAMQRDTIRFQMEKVLVTRSLGSRRPKSATSPPGRLLLMAYICSSIAAPHPRVRAMRGLVFSVIFAGAMLAVSGVFAQPPRGRWKTSP